MIKQTVDNKSKSTHAADAERWPPWLISDYVDVLQSPILPAVMPLLTSHGLFSGGYPGLGKTPLAKTLSMAQG
eukprot:5254596-Pyramimonas_sp.AAC.1